MCKKVKEGKQMRGKKAKTEALSIFALIFNLHVQPRPPRLHVFILSVSLFFVNTTSIAQLRDRRKKKQNLLVENVFL